MLDGDAPVVISSSCSTARTARTSTTCRVEAMRRRASTRARPAAFDERVLRPQLQLRRTSDRMHARATSAPNSGMTIAVAADHSIETDERVHARRSCATTTSPRWSSASHAKAGQAGAPRRSWSAYHTLARRAGRASSPTAATAPSTGPRETACDELRRAAARLARRGSGRAATSRSTGHAGRCSRRSAGTCSSSPRPAARADGSGVPAKGVTGLRLRGPLLLGHRDLRRCRSSPTRRRTWPATLLRFRSRMLARPRAAGRAR